MSFAVLRLNLLIMSIKVPYSLLHQDDILESEFQNKGFTARPKFVVQVFTFVKTICMHLIVGGASQQMRSKRSNDAALTNSKMLP